MKHMILIPFFIAALAFQFDCKIDQRISSDKNHRTILASADATNCKVVAVDPLYSFLFGLVPVFRNSEPEPSPGQTLRVTEVTNWKDYAVTAVGGWAITLVRRTRTFEFCDENLFVSAYNPEKESSIDQTLYQMAAAGKIVLHLKSGDTLTQVKILGFDDSAVLIEVTVPDPAGGFTDRAFLRDGSTIDGKQVGQDDKQVILEGFDGKKVTILKSTLHKIDMKIPKTVHEKRNLLKSDISRIAFEKLPY